MFNIFAELENFKKEHSPYVQEKKAEIFEANKEIVFHEYPINKNEVFYSSEKFSQAVQRICMLRKHVSNWSEEVYSSGNLPTGNTLGLYDLGFPFEETIEDFLDDLNLKINSMTAWTDITLEDKEGNSVTQALYRPEGLLHSTGIKEAHIGQQLLDPEYGRRGLSLVLRNVLKAALGTPQWEGTFDSGNFGLLVKDGYIPEMIFDKEQKQERVIDSKETEKILYGIQKQKFKDFGVKLRIASEKEEDKSRLGEWQLLIKKTLKDYESIIRENNTLVHRILPNTSIF